MGNEIQKAPGSGGAAMIAIDDAKKTALVKKVIFPESTPEELELYLFKCRSAGVNPLDRKIYPIKYGGRLTFVSSIDYMRSKAAVSGKFDGIDDVEYEGDEDAEHPDEAIVRVYRKDVSRPFVGRARWTEYNGGNSQWKTKPYLMLAKCAEAQALRRAFPDELDDLYDRSELDIPVDDSHAVKSTKPRVMAADVVVVEEAPPPSPVASPVPENAQRGIVEDVSTKTGNKNGKPWTRYGIKIGGNTYGTFDAKIAKRAEDLLGQPVVFASETNGEHTNLLSVELDEGAAK
jgi:phage recombination protein Bet